MISDDKFTLTTNKAPLVSVIMAVYNTDQYVKEAIESIQTQTLSDFELVIVDDGSTDNSPAIISDLAGRDSRIKLFRQENAGIGAATARAISESSGAYIAIMDSDDISLPNRLSLQKNFLDRHPDIDAVGSQWRMLSANGLDFGIDTHPLDSETITTLMFNHFALHHPTTMIRRKAIEKVGGYNSDRSCIVPDYDLFMRMQLAGCKFANLPQVLFIWRLNPSSTTRSKSAAQAVSVAYVRDEGFAKLLRDHPDQAKKTAQSIIYRFPTGSWQDDRIKLLLPEHQDSLLYRTWVALAAESAEEEFNRSLILWLRDHKQGYLPLHAYLCERSMPWFASLLNAYHAKEAILLPLPLPLVDVAAEDYCQISLLLAFKEFNDDFELRLQQALELQAQADFKLELVIFCQGKSMLNAARLTSFNKSDNCTVIDGAFGWNAALSNAQGRYFAYLEENFRFDSKHLLRVLKQLINNQTDLVYLVPTRFFSDALDEAGNPLLDTSPQPKWSRSTLLGKNRIQLSGFIHKRELLLSFKGNVAECGDVCGHALAQFLANTHSFNIKGGVVRYFVPSIQLDCTPLPVFQRMLLDWYFDYGMTGLPSPEFWPELDQSQIEQYARSLSDAWIKHDLFVHPGNANTIKQFYLGPVNSPTRWPLFKHMLLHSKKEFLISLWRTKPLVDALTALFYLGYVIIRNRCLTLFKK